MKLAVWEEECGEDDGGGDDSDARDSEGSDRGMDNKEKACDQAEITDDDSFRCAICDLDFSSRITLTGHYEKHVKAKLFEPFQCPECRRKKVDALVEGYLAWLNHLQRIHGKRYTPYFQQTFLLEIVRPKTRTRISTPRTGLSLFSWSCSRTAYQYKGPI